MLPKEIIAFLCRQNPMQKKEYAEIIATAQYYYMTHDEFTLDSTIKFTIKERKIPQTDALDILGIKIEHQPTTRTIAYRAGKPDIGPIRYGEIDIFNSIVTFPLSLFKGEMELKEIKKHYVMRQKRPISNITC